MFGFSAYGRLAEVYTLRLEVGTNLYVRACVYLFIHLFVLGTKDHPRRFMDVIDGNLGAGWRRVTRPGEGVGSVG